VPSGSPIYQKLDPVTGQVTNEFDGRIRAAGITFPIDPYLLTGDPPDTDEVQWVREDNGAVIAVVNGVRYQPGRSGMVYNEAQLIAQPDPAETDPQRVRSSVVAGNGLGGEWSRLEATEYGIQAKALNHTRMVLGTLGESDFAAASHSHDDRYYTEGEADGRYLRGMHGTRLVYGPYDTGLTGNIGPDSDTNRDVNHNLNLDPNRMVAVGNLYDGTWASLAGWRLERTNNNMLRIIIGNPSGRTIQAGWRGYFIYA
jgi:hypothetical protein